MTDSDRQVAERQRLFEREALKHIDALYRTALRMVSDPQEAEDLVQETYLRAYRALDQFQMGTNLRAWLFKILTNSVINRFRRRKRQPTTLSLEANEDFYLFEHLRPDDPLLVESAESEAIAKLVDEEVVTAISQLPIQYRMTVLLADVEGFSYKEIAEITSVKIGTVMSRLARGRRMLQAALWEYASANGYARPVGIGEKDG